jgi:hypothetical protein
VIRLAAALSLLAVACAGPSKSQLDTLNEKDRAAVQAQRVEVGMKPQTVVLAWGEPCDTGKSTTAAGTQHRWRYCAVCPNTKTWLAIATKSRAAHDDKDECAKQRVVTFESGVVAQVDE